jgi:hypothetical protein
MLPTQDTIKSYYIYNYTFLDDLSCIKSPYDYFTSEEKYKIDDAIRLLGERFKEYGWEGDGSIGIIWLPPFVDIGIEDTWGTYIWHVKQYNDGISFLACDVPLDFERIKEQNKEVSISDTSGMIPISIIETRVKWFTTVLIDVEKDIVKSVSFLAKATTKDVPNTIKQNLAVHYQNIIIRYFFEFLDECYLEFLIEAIKNGNPHKIKLRKSQIQVNPVYYLPEIDEDDGVVIDNSGSDWLTIHGFISDMWKAYKWEPFKNKLDMLFKSIDYVINVDDLFEIRKHVIIRNCMQHHEGCLDRDSLEQLGCKTIEMKKEDGKYSIEAWKPIIITEQEIYSLCRLLKKVADEFHVYVKKRVPTVYYFHGPSKAK